MKIKKQLLKIPQAKAVEILSRYAAEDVVQEKVDSTLTPSAYIQHCVDQGDMAAAITFICHSLTSREAIWWGCCCLEQVSAGLAPVEQQALAAARRWVMEPNEGHRRAAESWVTRAGLENAGGWLAQATFWSGGSMTPLNAPPSPVPPYLYAHAVAGAIALAAVLPDGAQADERYRSFLTIGLGLADGKS